MPGHQQPVDVAVATTLGPPALIHFGSVVAAVVVAAVAEAIVQHDAETYEAAGDQSALTVVDADHMTDRPIAAAVAAVVALLVAVERVTALAAYSYHRFPNCKQSLLAVVVAVAAAVVVVDQLPQRQL